jgi:hypothetical protein
MAVVRTNCSDVSRARPRRRRHARAIGKSKASPAVSLAVLEAICPKCLAALALSASNAAPWCGRVIHMSPSPVHLVKRRPLRKYETDFTFEMAGHGGRGDLTGDITGDCAEDCTEIRSSATATRSSTPSTPQLTLATIQYPHAPEQINDDPAVNR